MKLSWACTEELFRQEMEDADDIRLSVRLFRKCLGDKKKVRALAGTAPGAPHQPPSHPAVVCGHWVQLSGPLAHLLSLSLTLSLSHSLTPSLSLTLAQLSLTLPHSHSLSLPHYHSLTLTPSLSLPHSLTLTHFLRLTHSLTSL
jgi:hypothetical protein